MIKVFIKRAGDTPLVHVEGTYEGVPVYTDIELKDGVIPEGLIEATVKKAVEEALRVKKANKK